MAFYGSFTASIVLGISASLIGTCIMWWLPWCIQRKCIREPNDGIWYGLNWGINILLEAHHNTGHHPFTNLVTAKHGDMKGKNESCNAKKEPDVFSSYPLIRMNPYDEWRPHHHSNGYTLLWFLEVLRCWRCCTMIWYKSFHGRVNSFISMEPRLSMKSNYIRALCISIFPGIYCFFQYILTVLPQVSHCSLLRISSVR